MNDERLRALGRLEEKRIEAGRLRNKLLELRDSVRRYFDAYEPVESIKAPLGVQSAVEFAATQEVYKDLLDDIAAIKRDWGI